MLDEVKRRARRARIGEEWVVGKPDVLITDLRENFGKGGLDASDEFPGDLALVVSTHDDQGSLG